MRIIYKEPGKEPRTMIVPNTLKMLQDLEPNFYVGAIGDVILGPVVICEEDGEDFASLSDHNVELIGGILRGGFEV